MNIHSKHQVHEYFNNLNGDIDMLFDINNNTMILKHSDVKEEREDVSIDDMMNILFRELRNNLFVFHHNVVNYRRYTIPFTVTV